MNDRPHEVVRSSEVVGVEVKSPSDENLGEIKDLVLDKASGKVAYAVLEAGGLLGLGTKLIALPWNAMHYDTNKDSFVINADQNKLKNAPGFNDDNWPNMADPKWASTISQYYGTKQ